MQVAQGCSQRLSELVRDRHTAHDFFKYLGILFPWLRQLYLVLYSLVVQELVLSYLDSVPYQRKLQCHLLLKLWGTI